MTKIIFNTELTAATGQELIQQIEQAGQDEIVLEISSFGGSLNQALQVYDKIKRREGKTVIHLSGMTASAATVIAMSADEITMSEFAFMLIHKVLNPVFLMDYMNSDDLQSVIQALSELKDEQDRINTILANLYKKKTGKETAEILDLMSKDAWLTAKESLEFGLIDKVETYETETRQETENRVRQMVNSYNLPKLPTQQTDKSMNIFDKIRNLLSTAEQEQQVLEPEQPETVETTFELNVDAISNIQSLIENNESRIETVSAMVAQVQEVFNTKIQTMESVLEQQTAVIADKDEQINALSVNILNLENSIKELTKEIGSVKINAVNNATPDTNGNAPIQDAEVQNTVKTWQQQLFGLVKN